VTEDKTLSRLLPDAYNREHPWQGEFRVGYFDCITARYALTAIEGVDEIAVTNLDRLMGLPNIKICTRYHVPATRQALFSTALFRFDEDYITRIKLPFSSELSSAYNFTTCMASIHPVYEYVGSVKNRKQARQYVKKLEHVLGHPVTILSFGPTATDKVMP